MPETNQTGNRPNLLGIGAQKCASSWVHAALGAHPDVAVSNPKEIDFFSYYFDRGYQWYDSHFAHTATIRCEISPSYFHDPRTPERVHAYDPQMRIVALLRDPIARAYSNHLHEIIKGHIPPIPFADGLANNPAYIEQGLYARHLSRWLDVFPRNQVLVLFSEDIAVDPAGAARQVYEFAGLSGDVQSGVLQERRNESDRARLPLLRSLLRAGGNGLRKVGLGEPLARLKRTSAVAGILNANSIDLRDEVPPMDNESRVRLKAAFGPDVDQLPALLGRDTLPWDLC